MSTVGPADPPADRPDSPSRARGRLQCPSAAARKRFILMGFGIGILIVVLFGLFTDVGSNTSPRGARGHPAPPHARGSPSRATRSRPSRPQHRSRRGGATVTVSRRRGTMPDPPCCCSSGTGAPRCHQELPPLAAAVQDQSPPGGPLSHVRVIGVDSVDTLSTARAFIESAGVTFPVAYGPRRARSPSGLFYFRGDPYTVFVGANGKIAKIAYGDTLTPAAVHGRRAGPHSQRNVSAAATGAATAHTARTVQRLPAGGHPSPSVAWSAAERASAGSSLASEASAARQLADGHDHAPEQQQDQVEAVAGGQVHLGPQGPGHEQPDTGEGGRAEHHHAEGRDHGRRHRPARGSNPGPSPTGSRMAAWSISTATMVIDLGAEQPRPAERRRPRGA